MRIDTKGSAALLLLLCAAEAEAQECVTFRTEACPRQKNVRLWRGKGPDPLQKKAPRARPAAPAPAPAPAQAEPSPTQAAPAPEAPPSPSQPATPPPPPPPEPEVRAPAPPPMLLPAPPPPAPARPYGALWKGGWALLGLGVAGVAAGGVLVAIDGVPTCDLPMPDKSCPSVRDSWPGGTAALAVGGAMLISGAVMLGVAARRRSERPRMLTWLLPRAR